MHAKVMAHRGFLVCELVATRSISDEVSTNLDQPGFAGHVIHDTRLHLGVSPEALRLLKDIKRGTQKTSEVDWFLDNNGRPAFAWSGARYLIRHQSLLEGSLRFEVGAHKVISNEVPEGARTAIKRIAEHYSA